MDYENQLCGKGWIGDGCTLRNWGLTGVLPGVLQDFSGFVRCKKILAIWFLKKCSVYNLQPKFLKFRLYQPNLTNSNAAT